MKINQGYNSNTRPSFTATLDIRDVEKALNIDESKILHELASGIGKATDKINLSVGKYDHYSVGDNHAGAVYWGRDIKVLGFVDDKLLNKDLGTWSQDTPQKAFKVISDYFNKLKQATDPVFKKEIQENIKAMKEEIALLLPKKEEMHPKLEALKEKYLEIQKQYQAVVQENSAIIIKEKSLSDKIQKTESKLDITSI